AAGAVPHFQQGDQPLFAFAGTGTFAEEVVVSSHAAIKIPDDVPFDVGSLIGCGVTTGVGAAINTARVRPGSSVVVFGRGAGRMATCVQLHAFELSCTAKSVNGSLSGPADVRTDSHRLLRLWRGGQLALAGMITRRSGLDGINEAFRAMQAGEVIRTVIEL